MENLLKEKIKQSWYQSKTEIQQTSVFLTKFLCKCDFRTVEELILIQWWKSKGDSRNNLENDINWCKTCSIFF